MTNDTNEKKEIEMPPQEADVRPPQMQPAQQPTEVDLRNVALRVPLLEVAKNMGQEWQNNWMYTSIIRMDGTINKLVEDITENG